MSDAPPTKKLKMSDAPPTKKLEMYSGYESDVEDELKKALMPYLKSENLKDYEFIIKTWNEARECDEDGETITKEMYFEIKISSFEYLRGDVLITFTKSGNVRSVIDQLENPHEYHPRRSKTYIGLQYQLTDDLSTEVKPSVFKPILIAWVKDFLIRHVCGLLLPPFKHGVMFNNAIAAVRNKVIVEWE